MILFTETLFLKTEPYDSKFRLASLVSISQIILWSEIKKISQNT